MRCVLYDYETFEPITVIALPGWAAEMLAERGSITLPAWNSAALNYVGPGKDIEPRVLYAVHVFAEIIIFHRQEVLMLFTRDAETSLLLRSVFLSGQRAELQRREDAAFAEGVVAALSGFR